ncbi:MAG TPA: TlpA disulfide reductase family protein, partial [Thermoanaerobaculia bacterium]|nr:TlpA disulfide reductase family protein [Thermoanaerobaculia bacterium]
AELTNLASRYAQAGLVVVAASVDDPAARERVARFTKERQLPFPIWLDPETRLAGDLRVQTLPVTFVIDRQGRILWRQDEPVQPNDPKLETILRLAIGSPAADTTAAP